jgi:hypothetical protein
MRMVRSVVRSIDVITQEVVSLQERMGAVKQEIEQVEQVGSECWFRLVPDSPFKRGSPHPEHRASHVHFGEA